jgi:cytochrome d ubiquinol oxidase subunit I
MVAVGVGLIGLALIALLALVRPRVLAQRWLLWIFVFSVLGPQVANQAGWLTAEVGRQPWIVYGLLRTADAGSRVVSAAAVIASIAMFSLIYLLLFALFVYLLNDKIKKGPGSEHLAGEGQRA